MKSFKIERLEERIAPSNFGGCDGGSKHGGSKGGSKHGGSKGGSKHGGSKKC